MSKSMKIFTSYSNNVSLRPLMDKAKRVEEILAANMGPLEERAERTLSLTPAQSEALLAQLKAAFNKH